jgi:L-2-hydroxycarboxylate dehydrogenase (NAD+)
MSIASIVRGRVLEYQRTGKALPEGLAIDNQGGSTVDPSAALLGAFLPFGGPQAYKAFGLEVMVDILSGPLVGAAFADRVTGTANTTQDCNKGDLYMAIDVAQFRNYEDYLDDVETLVAVIKSTGESVYLPGEVEDDRATAAGGSITLDEDMAAQLSTLGRRLGVEPPAGLTG